MVRRPTYSKTTADFHAGQRLVLGLEDRSVAYVVDVLPKDQLLLRDAHGELKKWSVQELEMLMQELSCKPLPQNISLYMPISPIGSLKPSKTL